MSVLTSHAIFWVHKCSLKGVINTQVLPLRSGPPPVRPS